MQTTPRILLLKLLCVGTLLLGMLTIGFGMYGWVYPTTAGDSIDILGKLNIGLFFSNVSGHLFYGALLGVNVLMMLGAFVMLSPRKRWGFYLYALGNLACWIGLSLFFVKLEMDPWLVIAFYLTYLAGYIVVYKTLK